jgi:hypothetical protein
MYFKFNKQQAIEFCQKVNKGENIEVSEKNTTTGYCQPFEYLGSFYVIADEVTSKYTDLEPIEIYQSDYSDRPLINGFRLVQVNDLYNGTIDIYLMSEETKEFKTLKMAYQDTWTDEDVFNYVGEI